ncbi:MULTISPECIES: Ig-like domain-containing protein [unclassified Streptomyces]|uniref:Ig-like domain-containing protein n=1 Tax=unclassified Streptomyces TaxID=2593676 RepID=UPI0022566A25|nr:MULTISPECIES: Ig-like domain-containing protein [unclassified Streptomyces]MCX4524201.1 Ig-like domain-containing protein [Streptomyces sp. NBC_01551]MCX4545280.1 Ig-like domain-containing protein [Streptomyces sp. NBC_01565]
MFRSKTTIAAGVAGLLAAVLTPLTASAEPGSADAPAPAACGAGGVFAASPVGCTYAAAGTDTFTVPDGVSAITVDLFGAEGGSAAGFVSPNPANTGSPGGLGGETRATVAVSPGQRLQITLGAAGTPGTSRHGEYARPGGYGHGSGGGGAHGGGGSGGGGSDVRVGEFGAADRILVAGGGGGAGNGGPLLGGGAGGGPVAEPGGQGGGPEGSGIAGGGGTQSAHGAGGPRNSNIGGPGISGGDIDPNTGLPNPGSGGPGGSGGRGGNGGGGGGGGYFGGGGGSGGGNPDNLYAAGGGGGSSYAAPSLTDAALLAGVNRGHGKAVVSFRYGTALTLTADTSAPLFGHSVTFTATVTPANPAAGTPSGTVTFSDGATRLATVPLEAGRARFTTGARRPGTHALAAAYAGDVTHAASASAEPAEVTVGFSRPCITTPRHGALTVASGESLCIASGGSQTGPVTVRPGGALAVTDAAITGPVSGDGALAVAVCRSKLTGPVSVTRTTGYALIGSEQSSYCAGNTFTGPVTVDGNTGGVELSANRITGPLRCEGNEPAPHQSGNTVIGPRTGRCR